MLEESINILHLNGGETDILQAEEAFVKIPRTGIFICTGGWVNIMIDDTNYHVVKDCLVVYFAYSTLHIKNRSSDLTGLLIGADLETIQPLMYNVSDFNALFMIKQNPLAMLTIERNSRLLNYIGLIENTIERLKRLDDITSSDHSVLSAREIMIQQRRLLGQCFMLEIISCFTRAGNTIRVDKRKDDVLKNFITILYKNFKTIHDVTYYAKQLGLSPRYFSAVIKERSGQSPSIWISTALLVSAKQMLQSGMMNVREISEQLNFPNQSYFGKWFKAQTGISPLDFKNGKATKTNREAELAKFMPNGIFDIM